MSPMGSRSSSIPAVVMFSPNPPGYTSSRHDAGPRKARCALGGPDAWKGWAAACRDNDAGRLLLRGASSSTPCPSIKIDAVAQRLAEVVSRVCRDRHHGAFWLRNRHVRPPAPAPAGDASDAAGSVAATSHSRRGSPVRRLFEPSRRPSAYGRVRGLSARQD
jgi:hypothetical protein